MYIERYTYQYNVIPVHDYHVVDRIISQNSFA